MASTTNGVDPEDVDEETVRRLANSDRDTAPLYRRLLERYFEGGESS